MKLLILLFPVMCFASFLNSSVLMFHEWEFETCAEQVHKAKLLGNKHINLMYTFHFIAESKTKTLDLCLKNKNGGCSTPSLEIVNKLKNYYRNCLTEVKKHDLGISLLLHVDEWGNKKIWRNELRYDPLKKLQSGYSYDDFIINPLVEVLREFDLKKVELALQGEMGATVFAYPQSYAEIIKRIKSTDGHLELGVSLNYNKLSGGTKKGSRQSLKELFDLVDFVGFSAYAPLSRKPKKRDFRKYTSNFLVKLKREGVDLRQSMPIHFSEVGIGGGNWINDGKTPARKVKHAVGAPYAGIWWNPDGSLNPWQGQAMLNLRKRYHVSLINYLADQEGIKKNPVVRAFLWNSNSWDVQGLYKNNDLYRDEEITQLIKQSQY